MAKKIKDPSPGDVVVVRWLDSGGCAVGEPSSHRPAHLFVKTTCGTVVSFKEDDELDITLDKKTLILSMCSYGSEDPGSQLAAIWAQSIIGITNHGPIRKD